MKTFKDNVIVKIDDIEKKTSGGIILTDQYALAPETGVAIACGQDVTDVKEGDRVHLEHYKGKYFFINSGRPDVERYALVKESEIAGVYI